MAAALAVVSLFLQMQDNLKPNGTKWCETHRFASRDGHARIVVKAVTVRLDEADHVALRRQAERLQVRPGTLARMLVHAGLNEDPRGLGRSEARAALDRLVQRSRQLAPADAVELVDEARADLGAAR